MCAVFEGGKLGQFVKELERYQPDKLGISENEEGHLKSDEYRVLYSGGKCHEKSVGVIVSNFEHLKNSEI